MEKQSENVGVGVEVLETWFRRVWAEEDSAAIEEMFPSVGSAEGIGSQKIVGPEAFRAFQTAFVALVSEIQITVDQSMQSGEWTAALCSLTGICRTSGKSVQMTGSVFARIEEGKILEAYNHWDFMGLWAQLGFLPEDTFEWGLNGKKVTWT